MCVFIALEQPRSTLFHQRSRCMRCYVQHVSFGSCVLACSHRVYMLALISARRATTATLPKRAMQFVTLPGSIAIKIIVHKNSRLVIVMNMHHCLNCSKHFETIKTRREIEKHVCCERNNTRFERLHSRMRRSSIHDPPIH
jgi:hypothetical protein